MVERKAKWKMPLTFRVAIESARDKPYLRIASVQATLGLISVASSLVQRLPRTP